MEPTWTREIWKSGTWFRSDCMTIPNNISTSAKFSITHDEEEDRGRQL